MGADGLKTKINSNLGRKKVGYAEIFSRFGSVYQKITPDGKDALESFTHEQIALIARANNGKVDIPKIIAKANGSLRRVRIEVQKQKSTK